MSATSWIVLVIFAALALDGWFNGPVARFLARFMGGSDDLLRSRRVPPWATPPWLCRRRAMARLRGTESLREVKQKTAPAPAWRGRGRRVARLRAEAVGLEPTRACARRISSAVPYQLGLRLRGRWISRPSLPNKQIKHGRPFGSTLRKVSRRATYCPAVRMPRSSTETPHAVRAAFSCRVYSRGDRI